MTAALALTLCEIEEADTAHDYARRTPLVYSALAQAAQLGYACGIRFDAKEGPGWPVVSIVLPTGQVTWHCEAAKDDWDGHTTPEKYERIRAYAHTQARKIEAIGITKLTEMFAAKNGERPARRVPQPPSPADIKRIMDEYAAKNNGKNVWHGPVPDPDSDEDA